MLRPVWTWVRGRLAGGSTPARLRALSAGTVVLALLFALLGSYGVDRRERAIGNAAASSAQLLAAQGIEVRLLRADALASENFLRGGLEDPGTRQAYVAELAAAGEGLVSVSNDAPASVLPSLREVSTAVARYSGLVEQARANNRQGYPVGVTYLLQANRVLGDEVLPALRDVQRSLRSDVNNQLDSADRAGLWFHTSGWLLVAALVGGSVWLAQRFRRLLNLPLVAATAAVLLMMIVGGSTQGSSITTAEAATAGPLQTADLAAQARSAGFRARTQEAIALIQRGNRSVADSAWTDANLVAEAALDRLCEQFKVCAPRNGYDQYVDTYGLVRSTDIDDADWESAVDLSLRESARVFGGFDQASETVTINSASEAAVEFDGAGDGLGLVRTLAIGVGLLAAGLALAGYGQRLKEYR